MEGNFKIRFTQKRNLTYEYFVLIKKVYSPSFALCGIIPKPLVKKKKNNSLKKKKSNRKELRAVFTKQGVAF